MHSSTFPLHCPSIFTLLARAIRGNKLRRIAAAAPAAAVAPMQRSLLAQLTQMSHFLGDSRLAWATAGQMSHSPSQTGKSL